MDASNAAHLFEQLSGEDMRHLASLSDDDIRRLALLATIRMFSQGASVSSRGTTVRPIPTEAQPIPDHARMCRGEYWSESEESSDSEESSEDDSEMEGLDEPIKISVDDYIYLDEDGNELDSEGPGLSDLRYDFESMVCSNEEDDNKE
ncbi:hypothetical protein COL5a_001638 [Colletotrichum fioriniae]|nr:hypothetical protein COL5a_001638 [Colletotrichum fioriniae]